jgi:N6-L-threonylcarbamoyladenine synthase
MLVLGLETSCDDTAAAVLQDGNKLLSNIINDQTSIHSKYGGIVPELAGRSHIDQVHKVIGCALESAQVKLRDIDLLAVTMGPGLIGSLLVGLNAAKGISYGLDTPLVGVNHLEGHLLAIFLQKQIKFPFISLVVSGGHTDLYRVNNFGQYNLLGRTRDDAAGESFDKVAKMLGHKYPGGPKIENSHEPTWKRDLLISALVD